MSDAAAPGPERRPIAARSWTVSRAVSSWLARKGVSPNAISIAGLLAALLAGGLLAFTAVSADLARFAWLGAGVLIAVRLLANMFDGMVALETKRVSPIGELFNEVPDRLSDVAIIVGLGYAGGGDATIGYLAALAAVFTAYVRAADKIAGAPQDYRGPMAKPHRMFLIIFICVIGTVAPEPVARPLDRTGLAVPAIALAVIAIGSVLTAVRRLVAAASFLRSRP
jgi:phosphatidylglycerophosphate synthase